MRYLTGLTAGTALLALAGCGRSGESNNLQVSYNAQTGIVTSQQGLQLNTTSAAEGCMSAEDAQRPLSAFTPEQRRQIVGCFNAQAVRQINAQLPRQVDEVTRLDSVSADGPLLTYHSTVLRSVASLPAGAAQQLEAATRQTVCAQPAMRQTLQLGGSYAYRWVDNQGAPIHDMRIDAC